ncbi:MAG: hypothetical protein MJ224_02055 [archaeon]|nr:hypothetical protein [archaeon]
MAFSKNSLKVTSDSELLSYIINVTPELQELDLPVQGESIKPIGKIISSNERYRNAFIKTVNLIGLTVIKRNGWDNPWEFTKRGTLSFGQQIRELVLDLCNVYDYNEEFTNKDKFLETEVPNVFNYIHEVNFQKFYQTTTSDSQLAMAFDGEGSLFDFIDEAIAMLYESLKYDTYITDKYMLARRILDGTMTPSVISSYSTLTPRKRVSAIKSISNKFTFRNPNYNPAGVRRATRFDDQILIVSTDFEADFSTEVLATSFFKDEADMRARLVLCDGFGVHDNERLTELLGSAYIPFTEAEITALEKIPAVLISREWFMDYDYALDNNSGMKQTEFYNPTTLENNHYLHAWRVFSTSPFEQATVFTPDSGSVTAVAINPSEVTSTAGQFVQLTASVISTGFVNKAVQWSIDEAPGETTKVTIDQNGKVYIPSDYTPTDTDEPNPIVIKATSIYDDSVSGEATITVL